MHDYRIKHTLCPDSNDDKMQGSRRSKILHNAQSGYGEILIMPGPFPLTTVFLLDLVENKPSGPGPPWAQS